ncbi:broad-complex core protein isoforms 1/2/3/4/5-like isoform X1 [Thrips palmi]|uniref:Broad-complex core protein isoforms 1/2/3/4/5-like isoform X1 n=1 Tax=Thrips palmi TaxID=161013 RepID=A0A6P8YUF2_THRPL|nr:broad-complex core protein isoforms 1/2/3/4/5-like isoform X1 [Thrips palmi]
MGSSQQFSLRWNNYLRHITSAFDSLRSDLDLVDVTLSCEGKKIKAHKMLLSACSTYFKDLFKENPCQHPVIIFRNVKFADLEALIDFIYQGEVNVVQEQLASFLTTAELLAVQGLTDGAGQDLAETLNEENIDSNVDTISEEALPVENKRTSSNTNSHLFTPPNQNPSSPPLKRKKWSAPVQPNSNLKRTDITEPRRLPQPSSSNNTVDLIPVMSQVKVEMPEFLDAESGQINYNNAEQEENTLEELDNLEHSIPSASAGKEEAMDVFGAGAGDGGELTGEPMTPAELSQVLGKAGPSSEGSQDSLQVPEADGAAQLPWSQPLLQPLQPLQAVPARRQPSAQSAAQPDLPHTCDLCGKSFRIRDSLYKHRNVHRGNTTCPICRVVLNRKTYLRRHLVAVHGVDLSGKVSCPVCQEELGPGERLEDHVLAVHAELPGP